MMFGRKKLVCVRCGLTMRERDYEAWRRSLLTGSGPSHGECPHWFFDSRDRAGIGIACNYEARQRLGL